MIIRIFKKNKLHKRNSFVEPDEIFLDAKNIQNFDVQQFEGRLEKPISKNIIYFLGITFSIFIFIFGARLFNLQIREGEAYFKRSENNKLDEVIIFADRGIIYDRNKVELAWNTKIPNEDDVENEINFENRNQEEFTSVRNYLNGGFSHVLGYVASPQSDKTGKYWQTDFIGKDGLEKVYDDRLKGKNGSKIVEVDAKGQIHSFNIVNPPERGPELNTTLDSRVNKAMFNKIKENAITYGYKGGVGIIMDIKNGEILAATSYPEYDSNVLSLGKDKNTIANYINDSRKVFLNRITAGLYTPGSIVKPFFAYGALNEGIINPNKQILSTGSISIPNPYFPGQSTVFKDWKAHGYTNMAEAIAVSSDVYFYSIGGGYGDQKGLGISRLEKYARMFKIGEKTGIDLPSEKEGVIPNPEWKAKNFNGEIWRIGNTYHTSIGQYGFQVTPLEMVRATASLANGGTFVTPHFLLEDQESKNTFEKIELNSEYLKVIHSGMRQAVTSGTATALNVDYVNIAGKTGTAQLGVLKNRVNSWTIGFFPYENPKYAFAIMMESGPSSGALGAAAVMRQVFDDIHTQTDEYFH
jgi:penicillin-binding protein 2